MVVLPSSLPPSRQTHATHHGPCGCCAPDAKGRRWRREQSSSCQLQICSRQSWASRGALISARADCDCPNVCQKPQRPMQQWQRATRRRGLVATFVLHPLELRFLCRICWRHSTKSVPSVRVSKERAALLQQSQSSEVPQPPVAAASAHAM